jgi:hypothetical protein
VLAENSGESFYGNSGDVVQYIRRFVDILLIQILFILVLEEREGTISGRPAYLLVDEDVIVIPQGSSRLSKCPSPIQF